MRVFGTAGVRGIFNKSQTAEEVYRLVQATGVVLGKGRYGVGWDGRKSSAVLGRAAMSAISCAGHEVKVFGCVPTPVVAFGGRNDGCTAAFSVTASHNPPEFSGIKFFDSEGMEMEEDIERKIEEGLESVCGKTDGNFGEVVGREDVLDEYSHAVLDKIGTAKRKLRVVVDCGGGPGGLVTPKILRAAGHDVISVNGQVSWKFGAREPEPTASNLRDTCAFVKESRADLGLAHDGDADRLVLISARGEVVSDALLPMIFLRRRGNSGNGAVVLSENSSSAVAQEAERLGMRVIRAHIGKTFVRLKKEGGVMASEPSKLVDPSWGMWEDGIYGATMVCDALARDSSLLSLVDGGSGWYYRQINLPIPVDLGKLSSRVEQAFQKFRIEEKREYFGVKVVFKNGSWIMFRPSGTESKTRIYCETRDRAKLDELVQEGVKFVETLRRA